MTDKVLQCCYTNASQETGGKISSGWTPVAVSRDLPPEAYHKCVSLQNANSSIQGKMEDERGNVLNLLELCGDGSYLYMIRTQYGLLDRLGRANMFSHAFIFSWKDKEILNDPNSFLTIDNTNFKDNEADARVVPSSLSRAPGYTLRTAMEQAGITEQTYLPLIRCVYAQMTGKKATEPLFIQYDGTDQQLRAILYCVYYAIPFFLRKTLCAASAAANNAQGMNIVFSEAASEHTYYVDPRTGKNSVLTKKLERKLERYGFVDYVPKNCATVDAAGFFRRLEILAASLGDATASNELILKIANQIMDMNGGLACLREYSDEELYGRISDALRSKSFGVTLMEQYIAAILREFNRRKLLLTGESEAYLADRLEVTVCKELKTAAEAYHIYRLSTLPAGEAVQVLGQMEPAAFARYAAQLARTDEGLDMLDTYFADVELDRISPVSWESLNEVLERAERMVPARRPKTLDKADAMASKLYTRALEEHSESARSALERYTQVMARILPKDKLERFSQDARNEYWEHARFLTYSPRDGKERADMRSDCERCKMFLSFDTLLEEINKQSDEAYLRNVDEFFSRYEKRMGDERGTASELLQRELQLRSTGGDKHLDQWAGALALASDVLGLGQQVLTIRESLYHDKLDKVASLYESFSQAARSAREHDDLMRQMGDVAVAACENADGQSPVPLDAWLAIGSTRYDNSFSIFDEVKPQVLRDEAGIVVRRTSLLLKNQYRSDAESYVKSRGAEAKTVNKWLGELKLLEKKRRSDKKREGSSAPGGVLGGFFRKR